eukprot:s483_g4.t1
MLAISSSLQAMDVELGQSECDCLNSLAVAAHKKHLVAQGILKRDPDAERCLKHQAVACEFLTPPYPRHPFPCARKSPSPLTFQGSPKSRASIRGGIAEVSKSIPETSSSLEGYPCSLRPPPGLEHVTPVPRGAGPKARQISKSSMSTEASEVEQMDDHEELESNASGAEGSPAAMAIPGDMSMIARSWDSALRELLHSARDAKGAPLLAQHINSMDMQGLTLLVAALRPQLAELSCDAAGKNGCLVIQEALESATWEMQMPIMTELKGKVFYCSRHMHGNFVMQKVIQMLPPNSLGFMIYELKEGSFVADLRKLAEENAVAAALHIYACRVLQRLIECCGAATSDLVDILLQPGEQLQRLVKDPYSSNVIRSLVVCGTPDHVKTVMKLFSQDVMKFSRNRHASLVLEKCLEVSAFGVKADRFGNYIVQRVIETCSGAEKEEVKRLLALALPKLQSLGRSSAAGKHILSAAAKKFGLKVHSLAGGLAESGNDIPSWVMFE